MVFLKSLNLEADKVKFEEIQALSNGELKDYFVDFALKSYEAKEKQIGSDLMRGLERILVLRVVDRKWMESVLWFSAFLRIRFSRTDSKFSFGVRVDFVFSFSVFSSLSIPLIQFSNAFIRLDISLKIMF